MVPPLAARDNASLFLLATLVATATPSACSGGGGGVRNPADRPPFGEGRRLTAPSEVADCRPCTAAVEPGAVPWVFTFEVTEVAGGGRAVRRVLVMPPGQDVASAQVLEVPDMAPVLPGQGFFFGPQDVDLDGRADLLLATDRGVANAYARYWRYDPAMMAFVDLGTFPILAVDLATRRITSYERGGMGGLASTWTEYAWQAGRLEPVRVEELSPTERPGEARRVVRERRDGALATVEERIVRVP